MARPIGTRNPGYEEKRRRLAEAAIQPILELDGLPLSLRQTARAAGVSVPTMRHYFGDLDGVIRAAFDLMREEGEPYINRAAGRAETPGPLRESIRWVVSFLRYGWSQGLNRMHGAGLARGLSRPIRGHAYVDTLLEPMVQATEARLKLHQQRGELVDCDVRQAALSLVSPILVALIHQEGLDGAACRPLDMDGFIESHLDFFFKAYAAD